MTPGPTPVPPQVLAAMALPIVHHRSPDFKPTYKQCLERLKEVYRTDGDVLLYTASGTAGLESVVSNLTSPGDRVVVVSAGYFGERWAQIAEVYGCDVDHLRYEWGETPDGGRPLPRAWPRSAAQRRAHHAVRDVDRRRRRRAGACRGGEGGRRAGGSRCDLEPRRDSLRDRRVGPRLGRLRLAEGADGPAGPGDGLRLDAAWEARESARLRASTSTGSGTREAQENLDAPSRRPSRS